MVLVTQKAPDFTASAVTATGEIVDNFNLTAHIKDKYAVVFFWPMDFTFVCPSEIIAFDHRIQEFKDLGVEVIGVSMDSAFVHNAWRNTDVANGGIGKVRFPIVSDVKHTIMQDYGVEHPELGVALRASFFIDRSGIVRHQVVNDLPIGRNIDDMIRVVEAFQFHEEHGEVCPAQWKKGEQGMKASPDGVASYLKNNAAKL